MQVRSLLVVATLIASLLTPFWSLGSCCCALRASERQLAADQVGDRLPPCCAARKRQQLEEQSAAGALTPQCDCQHTLQVAAVVPGTQGRHWGSSLSVEQVLTLGNLPQWDAHCLRATRVRPTPPDTDRLALAPQLSQLCRWLT